MASFGGGGWGFGPNAASQGAGSTSVFGAGANTQQKGLFGASPASSGGGLFSTPAPATTGGGLFSAPAQPQAPSGGLFSTPTQQGAASGGLFSTPAQGTSSGGLFGSSSGGLFSTPAQGAAQSSGGLFSTPAPASSSSLFGGGSLFGSSGQQQSGFGLNSGFGQSSPAGSLGGGGLFSSTGQPSLGQKMSPQAAPMQQKPPTIPGTLPFTQLPEDLKNHLLALEKYIKEQRLASARLAQKLETSEDPIQSVKDRSDSVARTLARAKNDLDSDKMQAEQLKMDVRRELKSSETAMVTFESARSGGANAKLLQFLMPYFRSALQDLEFRSNDYRRDIDEIEDYLRNQQSLRPKSQAIQDVLKRLHDYFLVVASQMAVQHDAVRHLQEEFIAQLRRRNADALDPFEEAAKKQAAARIREEFNALKTAEAAINNFHSQALSGKTLSTSPLGASGHTPTASLSSPQNPGGGGFGGLFSTPGAAGTPAMGQAGGSLLDSNGNRRNQAVRRKR